MGGRIMNQDPYFKGHFLCVPTLRKALDTMTDDLSDQNVLDIALTQLRKYDELTFNLEKRAKLIKKYGEQNFEGLAKNRRKIIYFLNKYYKDWRQEYDRIL